MTLFIKLTIIIFYFFLLSKILQASIYKCNKHVTGKKCTRCQFLQAYHWKKSRKSESVCSQQLMRSIGEKSCAW